MSLVQSIFGDVVVKVEAKKKKSKKAKKSCEAAQVDDSGLASLFDKQFPTESNVPTARKESVREETLTDKKSSNKDKSGSTDKNKNKHTEKEKENSSPGSSASASSDDNSAHADADDQDERLISEENETNAIDKDASNETSKTEGKGRTPESPKEDDEARTIFVGNLPLSTTRSSLAKLFSEIGKVESARLRSVAVTGVKLPPSLAGNQKMVKKVCTNLKALDVDAKSSLQGYVVFASADSVAAAISKFNNKILQDNDPKATRPTRRIRVDTATPTVDPKRSVFVGNLPYKAEEATLQEHFCHGCGLEIDDIEGVRIVRDKTTFDCKGIGYILFKDASMVATALQRMHDSVYMKRNLRVTVCGGGNKNKKRWGEDKKLLSANEITLDSSSRKRPRHSDGNGSPANIVSKAPVAGAMRRVAKKNKRARGEKKKTNTGQTLKPGVSKRANTQAKADKRVKKLQKRISKGMGKARKST